MHAVLLFLLAAGFPGGGTSPAESGTLIVANMRDNTASIIDIASRRTVATLPTGAGPHEVAVSHDGRWAVISNYGVRGAPGNSLTVIDVTRAVVARTIDLGRYQRPHSSAFLPGDSILAVTSEATRTLVLVNFVTGVVDTTIPTNGGGSHMVAVTPDGKRAFTANIGDGTVSVLDVPARTFVSVFAVAPRTEGIAVTPGGEFVWVGSNTGKTVSIADTRTETVVRTHSGFGFPYRMAVTPDGTTAIVCDPEQSKIRFYNAVTHDEIGAIDVPAEGAAVGADFAASAAPEGIIISRDGATAYVALQASSRVAAVDIASRTITGHMSVGTGPDGIGYSQLTTGR
jgi:YVTN family beta-propeller protein